MIEDAGARDGGAAPAGAAGRLPAESIPSQKDPQHWQRTCPYWQAQNGGPQDIPGAHGPGTCIYGCREEPACTV